MRQSALIWVFVFFCISFLLPRPSFAVDCGEPPPSGIGQQQALAEYINSCNQKIDKLKDAQKTLQQVISTLNSRISLAQAQINQTKSQIDTLQKDIQVLTGILGDVNVSMDQLAKLFVARVRDSYLRFRHQPIDLLFSSNSFGEYFIKLKASNIVKKRDELILTELEKARQDFDQKKQDKLEKQKEVQDLNNKLVSQKKNLDQQQLSKKKLLADTQNDEQKYQKLLSQARAELEAIRRFVLSQGGASLLSNQTHCDSWGCFYNQRDKDWGAKFIGLSDMSLAEVGCLITSSAMVATHYGKNLKPIDIAQSSDPFFGSTAYMKKGSWSVNGVTIERTTVSMSTAKIDEELSNNHPVIVGLFSGPAHFIVIKGKNSSGYIMNDPFMENGYDRPFNEKYNLSEITQLNTVRVY